MAEIEAIMKTLIHLADHCHGDNRPDCPIIHELAQGQDEPALPVRTRRKGNGINAWT